MNTNDLMNTDYPIPDPSWDYNTIWNSLQLAKAGISDVLEQMAQIEDATPESDRALAEKLEALQSLLDSCITLLRSSQALVPPKVSGNLAYLPCLQPPS